MKAGEVVESWEDLSQVSEDKLIKLRDIVADNIRDISYLLEEEKERRIKILLELSHRRFRRDR